MRHPILSYGLLLFGGGILVWNEIRSALAVANFYNEPPQIITVDPSRPDPAHEGRVVHVSGEVAAQHFATDPRFPLPGRHLILRRIVEMQQWRKQPTRGGTTPTGFSANGFDLFWSGEEIDTRADDAPPEQQNAPMPLKSEGFLAEGLHLGGFTLPPDVLSVLDKPQALKPDRQLAAALAVAVPGAEGILDGQWIILATEPARRPPLRPSAKPVWPPGTLRVRFEEVSAGPYSLIARQTQNALFPFPAPSGGAHFLARAGTHPPSEIYREARSRNNFMTWALRIVGVGATVFGLLGVLRLRSQVYR
jgi:hypothetical protein